MKEANEKLQHELASEGEVARERHNIEVVGQSEKVIQMDLHCGVLATRRSAPTSDAILLPRGIRVSDGKRKANDSKRDNNNEGESGICKLEMLFEICFDSSLIAAEFISEKKLEFGRPFFKAKGWVEIS